MLKIENTEVLGWEHAIRGMRNPKNSWEKTDSYPAVDCGKCGKIEREGICTKEDRDCTGFECFEVGPNDLNLMTTLRNAGTDHRKFMRMITVYLDITAPLYWWKEFDTYKVGTVANSCSTMHKIAAKKFALEDFSHEHLGVDIPAEINDGNAVHQNLWECVLPSVIDALNRARNEYNRTTTTLKRTDLTPAERKHFTAVQKAYWWQMIQLLPSSYNQRRTIMLNYEVLANIYKSRRNHKLDEWHTFCDWIESLPYSELITGGTER